MIVIGAFSILLLVIVASCDQQPWPIKIESIGKCCNDVSSASKKGKAAQLRQCQQDDQLMKIDGSTRIKGNVAVVTYSSPGQGEFSIPDIHEFSVYQQAVMSAYAENNGYMFRSFNESDDTKLFENTTDARWFKIKLLLAALDPETGWARDAEYIMWIGEQMLGCCCSSI